MNVLSSEPVSTWSFWDSPAFGAVAVLAGVLITGLFEIVRDIRKRRHERKAEQRAELKQLLERISYLDQRITDGLRMSGDDQEAYEVTPEELAELRMRAGLILDPKCRTPLEDGLYAISELNLRAKPNDARFIYPLTGQNKIMRALVSTALAFARNEKPDSADLELIDRFANAGREGRIAHEHFWTVEHGAG